MTGAAPVRATSSTCAASVHRRAARADGTFQAQPPSETKSRLATSSWPWARCARSDRPRGAVRADRRGARARDDPVGELRAAVEAAAAALRDGSGAGRHRADARAAARRPEFGDYSTNAAMLLAPALGEPPRDDRGAARGGARSRPGRAAGARRGGGPRLPQPLPGRRLVPRRRSTHVLAAGDAFGAPAARRPPSASRSSSSSANPTGPADRGQRPPRRLRRLARARPRVRRPRGRARVLLQRRRQPDRASSGRRSARARGARRCRRTATRASTSPSWRSRSPARPTRDAAELAARRRGAHGRAIRATLERFRVRLRPLVLRAHAARGRPEPERPRLRRAARAGHVYESEGALWLRTTDLRRRQGPRAACAPPASPPTSPPTSRTTRTSASAGYDRLINVSAPTTTATSRG